MQICKEGILNGLRFIRFLLLTFYSLYQFMRVNEDMNLLRKNRHIYRKNR